MSEPGAPFIILANGLVHVFRSTGLVEEATVGVVLGNGVNIVLDWLFIVRMGLGTAGAAAMYLTSRRAVKKFILSATFCHPRLFTGQKGKTPNKLPKRMVTQQ